MLPRIQAVAVAGPNFRSAYAVYQMCRLSTRVPAAPPVMTKMFCI